jgi:hypothetical protein
MSTIAVLTPADVEEFGRELDKIREEVHQIEHHLFPELPSTVPGATEQPLRTNRTSDPCPVRAVRAPLRLRFADPANRLGLETHLPPGIARAGTTSAAGIRTTGQKTPSRRLRSERRTRPARPTRPRETAIGVGLS